MWFTKLGTTVKGPFNEDQLRSMMARGEFSRLHSVSTDKQNWESAAPLILMLEGRPTTGQSNRVNLKEQEWYYSEEGQKRGPYTKAELIQLIDQKTIVALTQVFDTQTNVWERADSHRELKKKFGDRSALPRIAIISSIAVPTIGLVIWFIAAFAFPGKENVLEEDFLRATVGRVQMIETHQLENGSKIELPTSHGTGFCVTESGYFLTNRHVISSFKENETDDTIQGMPSKVHSSIVIYLKGDRLDATLVHESTRYDLAILKVSHNRPMKHLSLSVNAEPELQTDVFAVGFPGVADSDANLSGNTLRFISEIDKAKASKSNVYADIMVPESNLEISLEKGMVNKLVKGSGDGAHVFHSAQIFHGNSGGPLMDSRGCVIGINTEAPANIKKLPTKQADGTVTIDQVVWGYKNKAFLVHQFRSEIEGKIPSEELTWE